MTSLGFNNLLTPSYMEPCIEIVRHITFTEKNLDSIKYGYRYHNMDTAHVNEVNEMKYDRPAILLLLLILWTGANSIQALDMQLSEFVVNSTPVSNEEELIEMSNLIVYGQFEAAVEEHRTNEQVDGGELINYVQPLKVLKAIEGKPEAVIRVISTGIEPMPKPRDPLNEVYPGPMAEGEYVAFLRAVPDTDLYTIIGGWQGVYPIYEEKLISLEAYGFPDFLGMTLKQLERRISQD